MPTLVLIVVAMARGVPRQRSGGAPSKRNQWAAAIPVLVLALALTAFATAATRRTLQSPSSLTASSRVPWTLPVFSWMRVPGADHYDFAIAADQKFESPVFGSAGHFSTRNTRAVVTRIPPNGTYYWRVRAVSASGAVSGRSGAKKVVKNWSQAPALLTPADGQELDYPFSATKPLFFSWRPVPGAVSYLVMIGRDPRMTTIAVKVQTPATRLAPPSALAVGTYYWRVVPLDAEGNAGAPAPANDGNGRLQGRVFRWVWNDQLPQNLSATDVVKDAVDVPQKIFGDQSDAARQVQRPALLLVARPGRCSLRARDQLLRGFRHGLTRLLLEPDDRDRIHAAPVARQQPLLLARARLRRERQPRPLGLPVAGGPGASRIAAWPAL